MSNKIKNIYTSYYFWFLFIHCDFWKKVTVVISDGERCIDGEMINEKTFYGKAPMNQQ